MAYTMYPAIIALRTDHTVSVCKKTYTGARLQRAEQAWTRSCTSARKAARHAVPAQQAVNLGRRIKWTSIYLIQTSGGLVMYSWYFINYLNDIINQHAPQQVTSWRTAC
jgi:hypothetical protein